MRTTVAFDDEVVEELMALMGAKTASEAIHEFVLRNLSTWKSQDILAAVSEEEADAMLKTALEEFNKYELEHV